MHSYIVGLEVYLRSLCMRVAKVLVLLADVINTKLSCRLLTFLFLVSAAGIYVEKGNPYSLGQLDVSTLTVTKNGDGSPLHTACEFTQYFGFLQRLHSLIVGSFTKPSMCTFFTKTFYMAPITTVTKPCMQ